MAKYELDLVDPKTSREQTIAIDLSEHEQERAKASSDLAAFVQNIARGRNAFPAGFMPIGNRVRELKIPQ